MKILLDFDGTLTNIEQEYEFEFAFILSEAEKRFGIENDAFQRLLSEAQKEIAHNPAEHGWRDNGRISAFCDEDLFMSVAAAMTLLDAWIAQGDARASILTDRIIGGGSPMMDLAESAHRAMNGEPLGAFNTPEPAVVSAINTLLDRDCEIVVASNSSAHRIIDKFEHVGLKPVDHNDNPSARFRVRGNAHKFGLGDNPQPVGFGDRQVDADRPYYADILRKERPQVVVGDVFSLDLALPVEMARREPMIYEDMQVYLRVRPYTPQWAVDSVLNPIEGAPVCARLLNQFDDLPKLILKR